MTEGRGDATGASPPASQGTILSLAELLNSPYIKLRASEYVAEGNCPPLPFAGETGDRSPACQVAAEGVAGAFPHLPCHSCVSRNPAGLIPA